MAEENEEELFHFPSRVVFSAKERNRRLARVLMFGGMLVAVVTSGVMRATSISLPWVVVFGLATAGVSAIVAGGVWASQARPSPADVLVAEGRILFRQPGKVVRTFLAGDIAEGFMQAPSRVVLRLRSGKEATFDVPSDLVAHRVLEAVGVSASGRVLRIPLASVASRIPFGEIVGVFVLLFLTPLFAYLGAHFVTLPIQVALEERPASALADLPVLPTLFVFGLIAAVFRFMRIREVVVGAEGVVFHGYWWRRLIPYSAMRSVERHTHGVFLLLKKGKRLLLPIRASVYAPLPRAPEAVKQALSAGDVADENLVRRETLLLRIQQAMARRGHSEGITLAQDRLDRNNKQFDVWVRDLREMLVDKGGYREGRVVPDDLAAVVEDPGASPERRIGAAIALSKAGDEDTLKRMRIAVEACADVDLRAALEEAAQGEVQEARVKRLSKRYGAQ